MLYELHPSAACDLKHPSADPFAGRRRENVTNADGQRHRRCMNELGRYGPPGYQG